MVINTDSVECEGVRKSSEWDLMRVFKLVKALLGIDRVCYENNIFLLAKSNLHAFLTKRDINSLFSIILPFVIYFSQ